MKEKIKRKNRRTSASLSTSAEIIEVKVGDIYARLPATKFDFKQAHEILKMAEKHYLRGKK